MTIVRKYFDVRRLVTYHNTGLTDIFDGTARRGEGQFFPIDIAAKATIETFTDKTIISLDSAECHVISSKLGAMLSCMDRKYYINDNEVTEEEYNRISSQMDFKHKY